MGSLFIMYSEYLKPLVGVWLCWESSNVFSDSAENWGLGKHLEQILLRNISCCHKICLE